MSSHARGGDYYLYTVFGCIIGEFRCRIRSAMRRNYPHCWLYTKRAKRLNAAFHYLHIAVGTHYHGYGACFFRCHLFFFPDWLQYSTVFSNVIIISNRCWKCKQESLLLPVSFIPLGVMRVSKKSSSVSKQEP